MAISMHGYYRGRDSRGMGKGRKVTFAHLNRVSQISGSSRDFCSLMLEKLEPQPGNTNNAAANGLLTIPMR
jgi:hypothetical protein